ncbi:hypothetical protein NOR51B_1563 [Luminiphilus syltensis NOR5-1B]|uniref:Water stress and hypersensitive response domain-containing protein n=2 Tax=Luminiphilus TaxID=1341118 RepID=B8KYN6_9GAMM|nr:hypothetical protein NOR51B_1563 [Luminiphilus syltensis NOR5-1B]
MALPSITGTINAGQRRKPMRLVMLTILTLIMSGCSTLNDLSDFDDPEVELLYIKPTGTRGLDAVFAVGLRVTNPNAIALGIDGLAYDVFLRDTKILSGVSNQRIEIGAFDEGTAEVELTVSMLSSLGVLRDFINNPPDAAVPYRLDAKLAIDGLPVSVRTRHEGAIDLRAGP